VSVVCLTFSSRHAYLIPSTTTTRSDQQFDALNNIECCVNVSGSRSLIKKNSRRYQNENSICSNECRSMGQTRQSVQRLVDVMWNPWASQHASHFSQQELEITLATLKKVALKFNGEQGDIRQA